MSLTLVVLLDEQREHNCFTRCISDICFQINVLPDTVQFSRQLRKAVKMCKPTDDPPWSLFTTAYFGTRRFVPSPWRFC